MSESKELFETTLPPANALSNAIAKLKAEIEQAKNSPYIKIIGEFLIQHVDKNPGAADKILVADKTIAKAFDEMRKAAEKKKVGNCAVLSDQEAFEIVLKYFGIESTGSPAIVITPAAVPETKPSNDFDVKLDDLL